MRELSLHLLDLAQNAVAAGAKRIDVVLTLDSAARRLTLHVTDDGRGMTPRQARLALSPFYSTRGGRRAGLGLPLCRAAALRTGGAFWLRSRPGAGTDVFASFQLDAVDCAPIGALAETLASLFQCGPDIAFSVRAEADGAGFFADADALRAAAGGLAPGEPRAVLRLRDYFQENLCLFLQKGERCMKSLEELAAIRAKMRQTVDTREAAHDAVRVVVGMATCGIAAGARGVLNAFTEEVVRQGLHGVLVTQTGCLGQCQYEPMVEVTGPDQQKVIYVNMTPEKAARVVAQHLAGGTPVAEYTIGGAQ